MLMTKSEPQGRVSRRTISMNGTKELRVISHVMAFHPLYSTTLAKSSPFVVAADQ